jgi:hypothetical protein
VRKWCDSRTFFPDQSEYSLYRRRIEQYEKKSISLKELNNINFNKMTQFLIYAILILGFSVWLWRASKDKSKWGINIKRVSCPVCQTKQPIIRMPNNPAQTVWGGTTCPKCHTNLDKYGNVIS